MSKLVAGNYAQFTLSGPDKVRTSGVIVTKDTSTITYQDEDTKLLCTIPHEDVVKVHSAAKATAEQLCWHTSSRVCQQQSVARGNRVPKVTVVQAKAAPVTGKVTKADRAYQLATLNPDLNKEQLVALFVDQLQMSPAGALTYYYNVMNRMRAKD